MVELLNRTRQSEEGTLCQPPLQVSVTNTEPLAVKFNGTTLNVKVDDKTPLQVVLTSTPVGVEIENLTDLIPFTWNNFIKKGDFYYRIRRRLGEWCFLEKPDQKLGLLVSEKFEKGWYHMATFAGGGPISETDRNGEIRDPLPDEKIEDEQETRRSRQNQARY